MSRDTNRIQRKVRIPSSKRKKSGAKKEKKPGKSHVVFLVAMVMRTSILAEDH
ncbi:MAG: hypothetical protein CM15mP71_4150 [Candidatus Poseidoniales archaeon]|nr:MAG: hypothetical protein CM15mP71_4150 [Candidatus Poseidoniales archaeon]